ncbi:SET domain-containing protein RMS1 [Phyllosticta citrichinensis]|uniref:Ribosomal lysine N-methyltransferase 4 n=1 Tax=Phyllosticta citrichinensis TaxID=1130410 RepID=A0ABR1XXC9_9PEZI
MVGPDDFEARSADFLSWLSSRSCTVSPKIQLADLRRHGAGRGVVAIQDIAEGEALFSIPRSNILSAATSSLSTAAPQVLDQLDPWSSLIVTMIYEYLRGSDGAWKPYFDVLPVSFNTLMFWSQEELANLQASAVTQKIGKAHADETFKQAIIPLIRNHAGAFFPDGTGTSVSDDELLALAHRMGSTIMAYAFDIEQEDNAGKDVDEDGYASEEEEADLPKGMVPLADMLNADADKNNARLHYGADALTMEALRDIRAGEELFNDYGPLPRSDLLRRYGYITSLYEKYDVVELQTDLIVGVARGEGRLSADELDAKLGYLEEEGLQEAGYDIHRNPLDPEDEFSIFDEEMRVLLATLLLPQAEFERIKRKGKLPKPSVTHEMAQILQKAVQLRKSQYQTSLEEDRRLASSGVSSPRLKMALAVRIGEKAILAMAGQVLDRTLEQGNLLKRNGDDNDGNGAAKRRKND